MIRACAIMLMVLAQAGYSDNPIIEFPGGIFLGEGQYTISNGMKGTYASHIDLEGDEWKLAYVRNGKPLIYNVYVSFNDLGFFDASISEQDSDGSYNSYFGGGYCGRKQCHLSFDLGDRLIEETLALSLDDNTIYRLGSLTFYDENYDQQVVAWEETMHRIDSQDSDKRD